MMDFDDGVRDPETMTHSVFRRVLVSVQDARQVGDAVELARRACVPGVTEARVLHLNLRDTIRGQRFTLETESEASYVLEATVFELRMGGIGASGHVAHTLFDRAAEAIVADAVECGADLIVLGYPRRGELRTRLFGSVTLRVLQQAPCPVLVASSASKDHRHRGEKERYASHRS